MAKATLFFNPVHQFFTDAGAVLNGGTLTFYETGTTTLKDTYTDSTKGTANPNPITLDSAGRPDNGGSPIQIWLDGAYKVLVKDSSGSTIRTEDNVTTLGTLFNTTEKSANYTITESDRDKVVLVDASGADRTITLLAAATAGAGFILHIKKIDSSSNTVTIDANSSENIDSGTVKILPLINDSISIICDGTKWHSFSAQGTIIDTNGNELLQVESTASAVNNITITNAATGNSPKIGTAGEADTGIIFENDQDEEILVLDSVASAVNEVKISNAATSVKPKIEVTGGDTNVGLDITTKGSGELDLNVAASNIVAEDARTNTIDNTVTITSTTTGTPAAGIGTGVLIKAESADENPSDFGLIGFEATDVTSGSEDTDFVIQTRAAGAALSDAYKLRVTGTSNYIVTGAPSAERTLTLPNNNETFIPFGSANDTSGEQIFNHATLTKVTLASELWDSQGNFDTATNYRFTVPTGGAGKYIISVAATKAGGLGTAGYLTLHIYKNGSSFTTTSSTWDGASLTQIVGGNVVGVLNLADADYIEAYMIQANSTSSNLTFGINFYMIRISA